MLLARLLGWIREKQTFNIFLLEILAVFIGITGSLYVDKWRQQQDDYETLDRELRNLYYELSRTVSNDAVANSINVDATRSTVLLTYGDWQGFSDEELLEHFWNASYVFAPYLGDAELQASNSTLSIPFNGVLAQIEASLADLNMITNLVALTVDEIYSDSRSLIRASKTVPTVAFDSGLSDEDLVNDVEELFEMTSDISSEFVATGDNLRAIRAAIEDPQVQMQLRQMIPLRQSLGLNILALIQVKRDVLEAIRRYAPDISVPFVEVGIDGSATRFGWQTYLPMRQDGENPDIWHTTLDLEDGSVKFRADRAWVVNWGSSVSEPGVGDTVWEFVGDSSAAFPTGTAILNGSNIPVQAGRYDIRFNTQTLEYSFERAEPAD